MKSKSFYLPIVDYPTNLFFTCCSTLGQFPSGRKCYYTLCLFCFFPRCQYDIHCFGWKEVRTRKQALLFYTYGPLFRGTIYTSSSVIHYRTESTKISRCSWLSLLLGVNNLYTLSVRQQRNKKCKKTLMNDKLSSRCLSSVPQSCLI